MGQASVVRFDLDQNGEERPCLVCSQVRQIGWSTPEKLVYRKVMVGFDGSPCADKALREGMDMAQAGAGLLVLTVIPRPRTDKLPRHAGMPLLQTNEICAEQARELQAQVRVLLAQQHLEAELQTLDLGSSSESDVAAALVNAAALAGADLIILGTHGRSGFRRFLLGSVAESVSRLALCPTLLVRTPDPSAFSCLSPVELYGMWPEDERIRPES